MHKRKERVRNATTKTLHRRSTRTLRDRTPEGEWGHADVAKEKKYAGAGKIGKGNRMQPQLIRLTLLIMRRGVLGRGGRLYLRWRKRLRREKLGGERVSQSNLRGGRSVKFEVKNLNGVKGTKGEEPSPEGGKGGLPREQRHPPEKPIPRKKAGTSVKAEKKYLAFKEIFLDRRGRAARKEGHAKTKSSKGDINLDESVSIGGNGILASRTKMSQGGGEKKWREPHLFRKSG